MKQLKIHKVTNPKTVKMLRAASENPTRSKAQKLVEEIYLDTGFKISGRHMVVCPANKDNGFLYIIEDVDSMDELLRSPQNQLPKELQDILFNCNKGYESIGYEGSKLKDAEEAVNDLLKLIARYCTEKDISVDDGISYVLTTYVKLIETVTKDMETEELRNLLISQIKLLLGASEEMKKLFFMLKKDRKL